MPIDSSKFFDSIRVKPKGKQPEVKPRDTVATCEWTGCQNKGAHRAPKGRDNQREYWHFCLNHVREYNQNYNFFSGMNADAVARYQKDALTGHRPTWKMGANGGVKKGAEAEIDGAFDPFSMFAGAQRPHRLAEGPRGRPAQGRDAQGDERRAQGAPGHGPRSQVPRSPTSRPSTRRW